MADLKIEFQRFCKENNRIENNTRYILTDVELDKFCEKYCLVDNDNAWMADALEKICECKVIWGYEGADLYNRTTPDYEIIFH